ASAEAHQRRMRELNGQRADRARHPAPPAPIPHAARQAFWPYRADVPAAPLPAWSWQWVGGYVWEDTWEVCVDPGHYEWQTETVLVEPAGYEDLYVCPLAEKLTERLGPDRPLPAGGTLYDAGGNAYPLPPDDGIVYDADGNAYRVLVIPAAADLRGLLFDADGNEIPLPPMGPILRDADGNGWRMVVVPVRIERTWLPARYESREVLHWVEPLYESRHERTWLPGHWQWQRHYTPWDFNLGVNLSFDF
ncbi:MAG TPA: hypothetical protein VFJ30_14550, partial [Phycisphaerae bacterium]|nr:hypothetical protein [Phycisphaerae bacterium]